MAHKTVVPMIATKRMSYNHRMLRPGDGFSAPPRIARAFELIGKAKPGRVPGALPPLPPTLAKGAKRDPFDHDNDGAPGGSTKPEGDREEINALRAEYKDTLGKRPFPGWDADELRRRIAEAAAS